MSVSETHELEAAAQKLNLDTLKRSLEANECDNSGKKDALVQRLGSRVLEIGVEGFLDSLSKQDLTDVCEGIKFKETGTRKKENLKTRLFRHILDKGLEYFLQDCTQEQLANFCSVLLLEQSSNDAMVSQIADEIMLTGTKRFLHKIAVVLLKRWCEQLGVAPTSAKKKQLVEQLMVHIFELEPLDEGDQEEDEGEQDGAGTKDDDQKGEGSAKKEQGTGKREKYVPPPLSTIKKGVTKEQLHNTFNATDLKEFCKQNNMASTGKKPLLIKRIIKFLETGEIEVPKVRRGGKRKRGPTDKSGNPKRSKSNGSDDTNRPEEEEEEEESEEVLNGQEKMSEGTVTSKPDVKTEEESDHKETTNGTPVNASIAPSASTGEVGEGLLGGM